MAYEAIIIVGHGSKSTHAQTDFDTIVKMVSDKLPDSKVRGAHMEMAEPSIEKTIAQLWSEGIKNYKIVPYFLYNGMHIKHDIPEILENLKKEYEGFNYKMGKPIGTEALMADILIKRASEILID